MIKLPLVDGQVIAVNPKFISNLESDNNGTTTVVYFYKDAVRASNDRFLNWVKSSKTIDEILLILDKYETSYTSIKFNDRPPTGPALF